MGDLLFLAVGAVLGLCCAVVLGLSTKAGGVLAAVAALALGLDLGVSTLVYIAAILGAGVGHVNSTRSDAITLSHHAIAVGVAVVPIVLFVVVARRTLGGLSTASMPATSDGGPWRSKVAAILTLIGGAVALLIALFYLLVFGLSGEGEWLSEDVRLIVCCAGGGLLAIAAAAVMTRRPWLGALGAIAALSLGVIGTLTYPTEWPHRAFQLGIWMLAAVPLIASVAWALMRPHVEPLAAGGE
jgi:hypothetical protein